MSGHGGPDRGQGRKLEYTADKRFEVASRVAEVMQDRQMADVARQIEGDPRTAFVRDRQRRVQDIAARYDTRAKALKFSDIRWGPSKQLDKAGRLSSYEPRKDFQAEAIAAVADEMQLPKRTVRKFYHELRQKHPEPEPLSTTWPRSSWKPPREESDFQWHYPEEADLYRGEWRQPADPDPDPDFAGSIAKTEHAERHRRRRK